MASPVLDRLPVLDGLRFFAALCVAMAHYYFWILDVQGVSFGKSIITTLPGIGMGLFFVLSGFVIHYNYHTILSEKGGVWRFFVARFSRLYPLYIVLFLLEFALIWHFNHGSCGEAGERRGLFLALPYFLTLTQSWTFGFICKNNLIYQYLMASAVAWSISVEILFYLIYPLLLKFLFRTALKTQAMWVVLCYLLTIIFCIICHQWTSEIDQVATAAFGPLAATTSAYQDSLLRWLVYFNPLVNMSSFLCGALAATVFLQRKTISARGSGTLVFFAVLLVILAHAFQYNWFGVRIEMIAKAAHHLYVPLIAWMIYMLVRHQQSITSCIIGNPLLVKLGEASYSIYLLHAFLFFLPNKLFVFELNPWVLYALWLCFVIAVSRASFVLFERPVQRYLRAKMK